MSRSVAGVVLDEEDARAMAGPARAPRRRGAASLGRPRRGASTVGRSSVKVVPRPGPALAADERAAVGLDDRPG